MQTDGNLVAYDYLRVALWSSGTAGNAGAWAAVQDDCNLVVYRGPHPATNGALWASNTNCGSAGAQAVSPVVGPFRVTRLENRECYNTALPTWTFCQHQGSSHAGTGIAGADDRYAWDVNLSGNSDAGRPVYATAPGRVVRYGGRDAPGGAYGAVLIEHNTQGRIWWSGYLHLTGISVSLGQDVTTATIVGYIGRVGASNDHLHFVMYSGTNSIGGLRSYDAQFTAR
ncbi:MAG TPA: peptidoglycan DD-metalloendopeptidase family protein [Longimicrobium sp.]|jgi:murein DD-endopeptidase MepM/ murein hydrolase activator NlpD